MLNVAVVGATGAVGQEMISAIFELGLPVDDLILASSERSAGRVVSTPLGDIEVREATPELFKGVDVAFFAAGGSVSLELAPEAARRGASWAPPVHATGPESSSGSASVVVSARSARRSAIVRAVRSSSCLAASRVAWAQTSSSERSGTGRCRTKTSGVVAVV